MNIERFQEILDAFGADPRRWPEAERGGALALIAGSDAARSRQAEARRLDVLLDEISLPVRLDLDAAAIVAGVKDASGNVRLFRARKAMPFSVGWPSFAGLAAAAVAGFVIGWFHVADYGADTQSLASDQPAGLTYTDVAPW